MAEFKDPEGFDEDFDPLFADDEIIDQEDMDDDNPYDTVDYPTLRNMPQDFGHESVYTPERLGSTEKALRELFDHNPARRPVLIGIIEACEGGCATSEIEKVVAELQHANRSVYAPTTLCRMLERTGALTLYMPEPTQTEEDVAEGVEYLQITETIDPVWTATEEALAVARDFNEGAQFRDIVLDRDAQYLPVYHAIMQAVHDRPRSKVEIEEITDTFDIVKSPRRFGGHFIDMLEKTDALAWNGNAWQLTDLGEKMLAVVKEHGGN